MMAYAGICVRVVENASICSHPQHVQEYLPYAKEHEHMAACAGISLDMLAYDPVAYASICKTYGNMCLHVVEYATICSYMPAHVGLCQHIARICGHMETYSAHTRIC